MAQFDVYRNKGLRRDAIPFVVVVQSSQFDRYRRRVVVPLVRMKNLSANTPTVGSRMNPSLQVQGETVILHPLDMISVDMSQLGEQVGSLAEQGQSITDALDELFSRSWG